jgi:hypothetical protein
LEVPERINDVRFSNRPFRVKRFQTIHHYSVDVAHGLVLLYGIGTKALPSWDSKTGWNNLSGGLVVSVVRHQRSLDRTGGLNKGEFLAHRNVHRSEDETANPTIEGTG